ncbi:MAG: histidine kinase, region: chemotaxis sensory transducer [Betaproteobacteria bacterium]|nr:histidine kinase, region: chemotaxis sensory transducer [Betaproteobacteria bacterium]
MLKNLKISTRLRLMAVLPLIFLLAVSAFAWSGLRLGAQGLKTVQSDSDAGALLSGIVTDMFRIRMLLSNAIIVDDSDERSSNIKAADERMTEIMKSWNTYIDHGMTPAEKELADKAGKDLDQMLDGTAQPTIVALRRGDKEAATTRLMNTEARELVGRVRDQFIALQDMQRKNGHTLYVAAEQRSMVLTYAIIGLFAAAALILGVFSWLTVRAIRRPVESMRAALVAAQQSSDLTQRVTVTGRDEVSEMGRAFNALMESLQHTLNQVSADALEVSSAATQMATASTQMTETSRVQSESAASTAAAVEEVTVSINQVADNTRETRTVSEQAAELSMQGEKSARAAAEQMTGTAQSVGHSMQLIEKLSQRSNEISGIVKVIRDIAEQTNLLALNAAIEAARAGEQGRGFAVVADEVRKLAERTSSSTSEISGMIDAIQSEVGRAVENLKTNNEQVAQGKSLAEEVAATLKRINEGARVTMERINDISSAAAEQGTASNDIARNVEKIAQMTEETSAAISQASTTAQQLEALASKLHSEVAQFKTA